MNKKNEDKENVEAKRPEEFNDLLNNLFMPITNDDAFENISNKKKKSN